MEEKTWTKKEKELVDLFLEVIFTSRTKLEKTKNEIGIKEELARMEILKDFTKIAGLEEQMPGFNYTKTAFDKIKSYEQGKVTDKFIKDLDELRN